MAMAGHKPMVLEVSVEVADGAGGISRQWQVRGTHWMRVARRSDRADSFSGQAGVSGRASLEMRAVAVGAASRPAPGHRLRDGQRVFSILAVDEAPTDPFRLRVLVQEEIPT